MASSVNQPRPVFTGIRAANRPPGRRAFASKTETGSPQSANARITVAFPMPSAAAMVRTDSPAVRRRRISAFRSGVPRNGGEMFRVPDEVFRGTFRGFRAPGQPRPRWPVGSRRRCPPRSGTNARLRRGAPASVARRRSWCGSSHVRPATFRRTGDFRTEAGSASGLPETPYRAFSRVSAPSQSGRVQPPPGAAPETGTIPEQPDRSMLARSRRAAGA